MSRPLKIVLIVVISLVMLVITGLFLSNVVLKSKIESYLQNSLPETLKIQYSDIEVSTWNGRAVIFSSKITRTGATTNLNNAQLEMDSLIVDGFGYWDFFLNEKITVESIQLRHPKLIYYHNPLIDKKDYQDSKLEQLKHNVVVKRVNVQSGEFTILDFETDSLLLKAENFTMNVMGLRLDENTLKDKIPFEFKEYNVHFKNLFFQLNDYENIEIKSSKLTTKELNFSNLKLYTKYSKQKLTRMIPVERDHFDIDIKSIVLIDQEFGYKQDSLFYFSSPKVEFNNPTMSIYRNKLVADDNTIKSLYSKMLRNLNFDLTLSNVAIRNAAINYTEKVKADAAAGEIDFSKLNANISNLSNTYKSPEKTTININAKFMKETPIEIEWYFDVNDVNDHFIFKADIGKLNANKMNNFTEPNLNVRLEGEIYKTYFTVDGYDSTSTVDLKLNYEDFKVVVMQKNEQKKNKFMSAVVNIFIDKNSDEQKNRFRNGSAKVERNRTKSVFNFLWLNAKQGLTNAMTGNGKTK